MRIARVPVQCIPHPGPGVARLPGAGGKATTACLFSSKRGGQQGWHGFSSVNVLHKANTSKGGSQKLETKGTLGNACSFWSSTAP